MTLLVYSQTLFLLVSHCVAQLYNDYQYYTDYHSTNSVGGSTSRIGKLCKSDAQCGTNEVCRREPRFHPTSHGVCTCSRCFGYDFDLKYCVPLRIRNEVCPSAQRSGVLFDEYGSAMIRQKRQIINSCGCTPQSYSELYPNNAVCMGLGRLTCSKCFEPSQDRLQCVPRSPSQVLRSKGDICSSDCECSSDLKCRQICRCPDGHRWDAASKTCVNIIVKFGSPCQAHDNCAYNSDNPELRYATTEAAKCIAFANPRVSADSPLEITQTRCGCGPGFVSAVIAKIGSDGLVTNNSICISAGSTIVSMGGVCHVDPWRNDSRVCNFDSHCWQCPSSGSVVHGLGLCRKVLGMTDIQRYWNAETPWNEWTGTVCEDTFDCPWQHEECVKAPIFPQCPLGYCRCRPGYMYNSTGQCVPRVYLKLGDSCLNQPFENYPTNAECDVTLGINGGLVTCKHKFVVKNGICVQESFKYVSYGHVCSDNCQDTLICSQRTTCQCERTDHFWNNATSSCQRRRLGDECTSDADCDASNPPHKKQRAGRVCIHRPDGSQRCSCDPSFTAVECLYPRQNDHFTDWLTSPYRGNIDDDFFYPNNDRYAYCLNLIQQNLTRIPVSSGYGWNLQYNRSVFNEEQPNQPYNYPHYDEEPSIKYTNLAACAYSIIKVDVFIMFIIISSRAIAFG